MKLIPEQLKYLRERKNKLVKAINAYRFHCSNRDSLGLEDQSGTVLTDVQSEIEYHKNIQELAEIEDILRKATLLIKRDFENIKIGTRFSVKIDGRDTIKKDLVLIDTDSPIIGVGYTKEDSDFGKAVLGKTTGDKVTYIVTNTNKKISLTIVEIDNVKSNYEHFIRETNYTNRFSTLERKELKRLKELLPEEYKKRHFITKSQLQLVEEELAKVSSTSNNPKDVRKRGILGMMKKTPIAALPEDDKIGIGSIVTITLVDSEGNLEEKTLEMVNRAVSTELASHYVERISPLGHAIYGLSKGDNFIVRKKHKPSIVGTIDEVYNKNEMQRAR